MGRSKLLTSVQVKWAYDEWCRGCRIEDIAAVLNVSRRTIYTEFDRRGLERQIPVPSVTSHKVQK